ncbi:site-specific integrase, partial [Bacteroides ovatus]
MNIKRNIIFSLESRKKNGVPIVENVPIRMRVIFASQRIEFTTGYRIDAAKWDADKQRVKPGCTNKLKQSASEINTDLLRYYTEIQNIFKE